MGPIEHDDGTASDARERSFTSTARPGHALFEWSEYTARMHIPEHVSLVWHGINDAENLHHFLSSPVTWGECDVRRDAHGQVVLRHDSFVVRPPTADERLVLLADVLEALAGAGRAIKLDLKEGAELLSPVAELLDAHDFTDDRLWFNASIDVLGEQGFTMLRSMRPDAIVQCPVDLLAPLVVAMPHRAHEILTTLSGWGINRVSLSWATRRLVEVLHRIRGWGHAVNIYGVPDLDAFQRAAALHPDSLTADFNFPEWGYHGRGSGQQRDAAA